MKEKKYLRENKTMRVVFFVTCLFITLMTVNVSAATSNNWSWPTYVHSLKNDWPYYSSSSYHGGTDFSVPLNTPVYSTCDGEVVEVKSLTYSYGKHIKIRATVNGNPVYIRYAHLNSFSVSIGDKVKAGQLIGYSGSTGNSTGPHLHYEIRNASDYYGSTSQTWNPKNYLPGSSYTYTTHESTEKPVICVDYVNGETGKVSLGGWAYWPGNNGRTVVLHAYTNVNGTMKFLGEINCNTSRPDVNRAYGCGNNHGFEAVFSSEIGFNQIHLYAITPDGKNPLMHTRTVTVYPKVTARAHVAEKGWLNIVSLNTSSGKIKVGTEGQALDLESFWTQMVYKDKSCLEAKLHIENIGWTSYEDCFWGVGTTGRALHIEAVNFRLKNEMQNKFELYYRCHLRDKGWTSFVKAGTDCGTTGENRAVECVEFWLVAKN